MHDLCKFSVNFPDKVADLLQIGESLRRNIREETITDLLMVELQAFRQFGVFVDYPKDEAKTGQDMIWEFVAPNAIDGRKYLRLHIQAKRAIKSKTKFPYWWYRELDHAVSRNGSKGTQHKKLLDSAHRSKACFALYMFYHPSNALVKKTDILPEIEGINIIPADLIPRRVTASTWPRYLKKVEQWRPNFLPLSALLCALTGRPILKFKASANAKLISHSDEILPMPGEIVDFLNQRYEGHDVRAEASSEIPKETLSALDGRPRKEPVVGRVIFYSRLKALPSMLQ